MIYHHDDADEASAVMHYHADQVHKVGKLAERLLYIFAACIALPLLAHMVATSDAAAALWQWLMSCDGVLLCALAGVPLEQKRRLPLPGWAEIIWPEQQPHAEHNRKAWVRAVSLARNGRTGWVVDIKNQERTQ